MVVVLNLEPGWLTSDVQRASQRAHEWETSRSASARPMTLESERNDAVPHSIEKKLPSSEASN
jgi:hypothetical protein